jgi:hypothetical protein
LTPVRVRIIIPYYAREEETMSNASAKSRSSPAEPAAAEPRKAVVAVAPGGTGDRSRVPAAKSGENGEPDGKEGATTWSWVRNY